MLACLAQFLSIAEELRTLERGRRFLETEFLANEQNQMLSNFLTHCELECTRLRETLNLAKVNAIYIIFFQIFC